MRIAVSMLACACVGCASDRDLSDQDQPPPLQKPASSAPPSPTAPRYGALKTSFEAKRSEENLAARRRGPPERQLENHQN